MIGFWFFFFTTAAQKVCHLLGINVTEFTRAILSPRIKVCIGKGNTDVELLTSWFFKKKQNRDVILCEFDLFGFFF